MLALLELPRVGFRIFLAFVLWMAFRPGGWLFACIAIVLAIKLVPQELFQTIFR